MQEANVPVLPVPEVAVLNGRPCTTSLAIADFFGKRHCDVMRDIHQLIKQSPTDFHQRNFALMSREVKVGNGASRNEPSYNVFFDGFILLVMGYTGPKALQLKLVYRGFQRHARPACRHAGKRPAARRNVARRDWVGTQHVQRATLQRSDTRQEI